MDNPECARIPPADIKALHDTVHELYSAFRVAENDISTLKHSIATVTAMLNEGDGLNRRLTRLESGFAAFAEGLASKIDSIRILATDSQEILRGTGSNPNSLLARMIRVENEITSITEDIQATAKGVDNGRQLMWALLLTVVAAIGGGFWAFIEVMNRGAR